MYWVTGTAVTCLLLTASSKMWEKKWLKKRTVNQKGIRTENFGESQPFYAAKNKKAYLEENTRSVAEQPFGKTARMGANHRLTQTFQQENNPFELKGKEAETNKERWLDRARTLLGCKNAIFFKTREERLQKWFSNYKGCLLSFKSQGLWLGFSRPDDPSPNSLGKMSAHHNHGTWLPAPHFKRWSHLKLWACLQLEGSSKDNAQRICGRSGQDPGMDSSPGELQTPNFNPWELPHELYPAQPWVRIPSCVWKIRPSFHRPGGQIMELKKVILKP